ncbi:hypothetical protein, partial [Bacteroides helcogenes]|uniref:hypothetical protein n=1 Tax=Bacteroides helcogenes TaxID=290053 RepID=UPI002A91CF43
RTEKLSPVTPMVLRNSGRVGSRRFREAPVFRKECGGFICLWKGRRRIFQDENHIKVKFLL